MLKVLNRYSMLCHVQLSTVVLPDQRGFYSHSLALHLKAAARYLGVPAAFSQVKDTTEDQNTSVFQWATKPQNNRIHRFTRILSCYSTLDQSAFAFRHLVGLPSNHGNYGSKCTLSTHAGRILGLRVKLSAKVFADQHQYLVNWDLNLWNYH